MFVTNRHTPHRQGQRAEHTTQAILGEVMAASATAPEPPTPPQPQAAPLGCPQTDDKLSIGSDLSDKSEVGVECSHEMGVDTIEGEEDDGNGASLDKSYKTNGESVDEAFGVWAKIGVQW